MRQHRVAISKSAKPSQSEEKSAEEYGSRVEERLYGSGGAFEKILRNAYNEGFAKLQANKFESKAAKDEWLEFRNNLTPEELALVTDNNWK
jgi:hypothetical protein